jgi:hypothetical protein
LITEEEYNKNIQLYNKKNDLILKNEISFDDSFQMEETELFNRKIKVDEEEEEEESDDDGDDDDSISSSSESLTDESSSSSAEKCDSTKKEERKEIEKADCIKSSLKSNKNNLIKKENFIEWNDPVENKNSNIIKEADNKILDESEILNDKKINFSLFSSSPSLPPHPPPFSPPPPSSPPPPPPSSPPPPSFSPPLPSSFFSSSQTSSVHLSHIIYSPLSQFSYRIIPKPILKFENNDCLNALKEKIEKKRKNNKYYEKYEKKKKKEVVTQEIKDDNSCNNDNNETKEKKENKNEKIENSETKRRNNWKERRFEGRGGFRRRGKRREEGEGECRKEGEFRRGRGRGRRAYTFENESSFDKNAEGWVWKRDVINEKEKKVGEMNENIDDIQKLKRTREKNVEEHKEPTSVGFLQFGWKKPNT